MHLRKSAGLILFVFTVACQDEKPAPAGLPGERVTSQFVREVAPEVPEIDSSTQLRGNTEVALELLRLGRPVEETFVLSPHSLLVALAMTYEGAGTNTETQMAQALHFALPKPNLHRAFNALDQILASRVSPFISLNIVNALFGDKASSFQQPFVDALAKHYGAPLSRLDFRHGNPDEERVAINRWVTAFTRERIPELIPPGKITLDTRLVLVNAISFLGSWKHPFSAYYTKMEPFANLAGTPSTVAMMNSQWVTLPHTAGAGFRAVELPYEGDDLALLIVVPDSGTWSDFVSGLDATGLRGIVEGLQPRLLNLKVPRFEVRTPFDAKKTLQTMGMVDAFNFGLADFRAIDPREPLHVADVIHEAVLTLNEKGTEAQAATAVILATDAGAPFMPDPPLPFAVDQPFLFFLRDRPTGAILFVGRVTNLP